MHRGSKDRKEKKRREGRQVPGGGALRAIRKEGGCCPWVCYSQQPIRAIDTESCGTSPCLARLMND